jgi:predicted RNA-binding Zn ribbon-like protein
MATVDMRDFRWFGGRLSLNFVATLGKPHTLQIERLPAPADLARWFQEAGLTATGVSTKDLKRALELREALYGLFTGTKADLDTVNRWATRPIPGGKLELTAGRLTMVQPVLNSEDLLTVVARDAVDLLTGPVADRVRECDDHDCALLFVDESRGGRRRWCSMDTCGARSKMARYRAPRS